MPGDPGLANDTCIFIEAVTGDGGNHNGNGIWWLSPDIKTVGPVSGLDRADAGHTNSAEVKFHRKPAASNCNFPGDESATVQLWVANPSLVMSPDNPASAALVGFIGSPLPPEGGDGVQSVDWIPTHPGAGNNPKAPGPKCLVARSYPESLLPSATSFFAPDDQHVAQHNICVVACPLPTLTITPSPLPGICKLNVTTLNPEPVSAKVVLRAVLDQRPSQFVRTVVTRRIEKISASLDKTPPPGFGIDVSPLSATVIDKSHPPQTHPTFQQLSFEAALTLAGGRLINFTFFADLHGVNSGTAYIFHLTQIGSDNRVQGGLTVVIVRP